MDLSNIFDMSDFQIIMLCLYIRMDKGQRWISNYLPFQKDLKAKNLLENISHGNFNPVNVIVTVL